MEKVNIYVDFDWLRLGAIELVGRLMNYGIYPKKVFRSHRSGHWLFYFSNDVELKNALEKLAEPEYNIIYNEDISY